MERDPNDGCFWLSFKDYMKFFYITSICFYNPTWHNNWVQDQQTSATRVTKSSFSTFKFQIVADIDTDFILSINQIQARHVDETMLGSYQYAPVKVVIAKIIERKDKKPDEDGKDVVFIEGDYYDGCTTLLRLGALPKGEYMLYYNAEWTALHPVRKVTISMYCPHQMDIKRVKEGQFGQKFEETMTNWLRLRLKTSTLENA